MILLMKRKEKWLIMSELNYMQITNCGWNCTILLKYSSDEILKKKASS